MLAKQAEPALRLWNKSWKLIFRYLILSISLFWYGVAPAQPQPVYLGLDAESGYKGSTSAEAIASGILIAIDEINKAGGVVNGRPPALLKHANSSVPAHGVDNIEELAANSDVAAVFELPDIQEI